MAKRRAVVAGIATGQSVWLVGGIADVYLDQKTAESAIEKVIVGELAQAGESSKAKAIHLLLKAGDIEAALDLFNEVRSDYPLPYCVVQVRGAGEED